MMIPKTQNRNRCVMRHPLDADPTGYPAHLTFQAFFGKRGKRVATSIEGTLTGSMIK